MIVLMRMAVLMRIAVIVLMRMAVLFITTWLRFDIASKWSPVIPSSEGRRTV